MKKDGPDVEVDVYAFMTTTPNELTATIMHDRMPVLLSEERDFDTWLNGSPVDAFGLVITRTKSVTLSSWRFASLWATG